MSKATSSQNSLTAGEFSPRAKGRYDLAKYASGVGKLENFLINQLGGVSFRPGTRYIAETKDSSKASRLIPFQYQADQDYVIEMGDQYFKLYENDTDAVVDTQTDTYTKLLLHLNANDGSKEISDSGNTGHVATQAGTATISSAQAKFGAGSLLLDGDSDYITVPDHADWYFADAAFTIDFQIRFNSVGTTYVVSQLSGSQQWFIQIVASTIYLGIINAGGSTLLGFTCPWSPSINTWYHLALVRIDNADAATSWRIFINGVAQTLTKTGGNWNASFENIASALSIGAQGAATYLNGYLDEFRISKGLARWTSDFTSPTTAYSSDANTQLLLHFESLDTSSVTAPKIPTFAGTAQIDTAQYKDLTGYTVTRASLLLDGNSDYISFSDNADWNFGTGDFTIEAFVRFAGIGAQQTICGQYEDANNYWFCQITAANKLQIKFVDGAASRGDYITTAAITGLATNTWYHFVFVRNGASVYIFVNGTSQTLTETTAISTNDVGDMAAALVIGQQNSGTYFNGWIDEPRISKGLARWTAAFTSTAAEYALTPIVITEITTPYLEADIFDVHYAQNNDILYLVHPDYAPRKLSRTSATAFSLSLVSFVRGPFLDTNTATTTITPSADAGNGITLTASASTFDALHVGSLWRVKSGVVKITAYTSATVVTGDVQTEPDGSAGGLATGPGATTDWAEGAFSTYRGYPSAIAFHEQRLYYANTEHEPQKFWASVVGAYDNFDEDDASADDAFTFEVATEQRNAIKWLSSGNRVLNLGTQGGTFSASSGDTSAPISPTNIMVNRDTNYGVAGLMPKRISSFLYYIQRDYLRLRELSYSFQIDSTISNDMTLLAEHILKDGSGVADLDHQQAPNDRIYCVREDGEIAVLTRNPEQDVMGWCRFKAGDDSTGPGLFESVCVIPKAEADDQVWVIVKRIINGSTKRFIEFFMTEDFDEDWDAIRCDSSLSLDSPVTITGATAADPVVITAVAHGFSNGDQVKINGVSGMTEINDGIYLIANKADDTFELTTLLGVDVDGTAYTTYLSGGEVRKMVTNISGLTHLEGETVVAQVDGYIPTTETFTVTGGAITLPAKAAVVHVGLPYDGTIQLLKLSDGSPLGTGQTKQRRIYKGTLRLDRSQGLSIGRTDSTLDDLNYNDETDSEALFTGDMEKVFQTTWDDADEIIIKQTMATPANILAIILRSETEEG